MDVAGKKRYYTDYKKVCVKMGLADSVLVDPIDTNHMDCMSRTVNIKEFCLAQRKIFKSPFLRGYINTKMKEVVCEAGTAMKISVTCNEVPALCKETAMKGCESLRLSYAHDLETNHATKIDGNLQCYFAMKSKTDNF